VPAPDALLGASARQLLDVAELLFAERGIEAVSLREIVSESGQNNSSAVKYHFGTREDLIVAVVARRMWFVDGVRNKRLDILEATGQDDDIHAILWESQTALSDAVLEQPWGARYLCVLAQVLFHPGLDIEARIDPALMTGQARVRRMVRTLLPDLPAQVFEDRAWLFGNGFVHALAYWIRKHGPIEPQAVGRYQALVSNMIDFFVAGLTAPVEARAAGRRPAGRSGR
jgi:AcrR family transcriptional regulator